MHRFVLLLVPLVVKRTLATPFFRVEVANGKSAVPFDPSWVRGIFGDAETEEASHHDDDTVVELPPQLTFPEFVEIYEFDDTSLPLYDDTCTSTSRTETLLKRIGKAAREVVDASKSDAVLFRNLTNRIRNAQDFAIFFQGCLDGPDGWRSMEYVPFGPARKTLEGVDLVTPFPPDLALGCHNELSYNPRPANLIAFYCLEKAEQGGETILTRNSDLTAAVSEETQQFVRDHGGVLYAREYPDESYLQQYKEGRVERTLPSWQEKTGSTRREDARKFFTDLGFSEDEVSFDDHGTLHVKNIHSGFIDAPKRANEDMKRYWFNILYTGVFKLADGTAMPPSMLRRLEREEWVPARVLQLEPGDWIVIRNRVVQHGRLPFVDSGARKRKILTVYTE